MHKHLLIIFLTGTMVFFVAGWTTKQTGLVKNASKQQVIDQLDHFVIGNNYSFEYGNPQKGLFQIFVKETGGGGHMQTSGKTTYWVPNEITEWRFSLTMNQVGPDVAIYGTSKGGLAPGRYFKKFMEALEDHGFNVLYGKDFKVNDYLSDQNTAALQNQNVPVGPNPPVRINNNQTMPSAASNQNLPPYQAPVQLSDEAKAKIREVLDELEQATFDSCNNQYNIEERLSLLELHYFNKQLLNMSVDARIMAIKNKIKASAASK